MATSKKADEPFSYDVFLSFKHEDIGTTLTSDLYQALEHAGIKTFIGQRLEAGDSLAEQLMPVIEQSMISVVVLSTRYADSTCRLEQLVKIMECRRTLRQEVFPVFYDVDASDVRNETGHFAKAFDHEHKDRDADMVQRWRAALTEVAKLPGWDLRIYRDVSSAVHDIVEYISGRLRITVLSLYCFLFPEGYEFRPYELVQMWIAEGYIKERLGKRMEDTGMSYFNYLVDESFFVRSRYDYRVDFDSVFTVSYTPNNLYKIKTDKLGVLENTSSRLNYFRAVDTHLDGASATTQHLSLISKDIDQETFKDVQKLKKLRTLLLLSGESSITDVPRNLFWSLNMLRTLNLSGTLISELPSSIRNVKELRYLDVSYTPITGLPESICSLHHLQTLKFRGCVEFDRLPEGLKWLTNLRHLELDIMGQLDALPAHLGKLTNLQTLSAFLVGRESGCGIGELKNLNDLRGALHITRLENVSSTEADEASLIDKKSLHRLELQWSNVVSINMEELEKILESLKPHCGLKELQIKCYGGSKLPTWISDPSFADLVAVTLYKCKNCVLPSIGQLPGLKILSILEMNEVKEINHQFFRDGQIDDQAFHAFPKLERLEVDIMLNLKEWQELQEGDLPSLIRLIVDSCPELVTLPSLSGLNSLRHLEVKRCPKLLPSNGLPDSLESLMIIDCPQIKKCFREGGVEEWTKRQSQCSISFDDEEDLELIAETTEMLAESSQVSGDLYLVVDDIDSSNAAADAKLQQENISKIEKKMDFESLQKSGDIHNDNMSALVKQITHGTPPSISSLRLLSHEDLVIMVAKIRCEEIANEKFNKLVTTEDWVNLIEALKTTGPVKGSGERLSAILDTCLSEYDTETEYFDKAVRDEKRDVLLMKKALDAYIYVHTTMLTHLRRTAIENFKASLEQLLSRGEGFASSVRTCTNSFRLEIDQGCEDSDMRQANLDTSSVASTYLPDIDAHASFLRKTKLSEFKINCEREYFKYLAAIVQTLLEDGRESTWDSIRKLLKSETEDALSKLSTEIVGFELDEQTIANLGQDLSDYARNLVVEEARRQADDVKILKDMKSKFTNTIKNTRDAHSISLKLLSVRACVCLDEKQYDIEEVLFSSLIRGTNGEFLNSSTWSQVSSKDTLITPLQCMMLWRKFKAETENLIKEAESSEVTKVEPKAPMASAAQDLLLGKIVSIIENEASSIAGVRDQVDDIKQELVSMKAFLQDADGNKAHTNSAEMWEANVRNCVYDVENVIGEFMYRINGQKYGGRVARGLKQIINIPKGLWYKRQIANRLDEIKGTIKAISESNQTYGVGAAIAQEGTRTSQHIQKWISNEAESSLFINEDELVGIEAQKQRLLGFMVNPKLNQMVLSVFGMGGSGKTTLIAKAYNNDTVKRHFDCYAWITVSQKYEIDDLLRSLIKQFHQARKEEVPGDINTMTFIELLGILVNDLKSKRYLVVLDDVWDITLWSRIKVSLRDEQSGSRVVITTRNEDIACYGFGVESQVHKIVPLGEEDSWDLFCKKAFSTYPNKSCPAEFELLALELVGKCEGLPLAIVALGGLMSSKTSFVKWRSVCSSLNWHLENDRSLDSMKSILLLSFNDLPYRLKNCFLYCSLFPEDYSIKRKKLIRLWMAEGFVEHVKGLTPEMVADKYLMELCFRSMLQVVMKNEAGRPKECKMHDLMRENALSISEKEMFCAVYDGKDEAIEARRLSVQFEGEIKSRTGISQLRSILVFVKETMLPSECKYLRVLDLENVSIEKLPDSVRYFFNLKYLNLRGTQIKELPKSIGRLFNLQTLDISHTKIETLPKGLAKFLNLRHLIMYHYTGDWTGFVVYKGTRAPMDVSKWTKLQVLSCVVAEGDIIRQVGSMTQLTGLGITNVKQSDEVQLCDSIQKLQLLRMLTLMACDENEILRIDALCPPPLLKGVTLVGKLEKVPRWLCSLQHVTAVCLHWARLDEDILPHIENLPNLGKLQLTNAYIGKQLYFRRGFVKLTELYLVDFPLVNKITIEKGAMRNLQKLYFGAFTELEKFPLGLQNLSNLQKLELMSLPVQVIKSIRKGAVDRLMVQHIPEINYYFEDEMLSTWFYESLS